MPLLTCPLLFIQPVAWKINSANFVKMFLYLAHLGGAPPRVAALSYRCYVCGGGGCSSSAPLPKER